MSKLAHLGSSSIRSDTPITKGGGSGTFHDRTGSSDRKIIKDIPGAQREPTKHRLQEEKTPQSDQLIQPTPFRSDQTATRLLGQDRRQQHWPLPSCRASAMHRRAGGITQSLCVDWPCGPVFGGNRSDARHMPPSNKSNPCRDHSLHTGGNHRRRRSPKIFDKVERAGSKIWDDRL